MRKTFLHFSIAAALFACDSKKAAPESDTTNTHQSAAPSPKELSTVKFSVFCSNKEINELIAEDTLKNWARDFALGGTFNDKHDVFDTLNQTLTDGVMMWYNIDKFNNKRRIVLAIQKSNTVDARQDMPTAQPLTYPDSVFTYDITREFNIEKHMNARSEKLGVKANLGDVGKRIVNFKKLLERSTPGNYPGTVFNTAWGAFFQNNPDSTVQPTPAEGLLWKLVNQPGAKGVRYYFAYKEEEKENKIRIILVATDKDGNNIVRSRDARSGVVFDDGIIVQKSIPPGNPIVPPACP